MKGMIKDALILFAITLIAGLMLGVVNDITKEPIAQQEQKAKNEACQNVLQRQILLKHRNWLTQRR